MRDEAVKAAFAALEGEPRPEFITALRKRLEREWTGTAHMPTSMGRAAQGASELGQVVQIRDLGMERGADRAPTWRRPFAVGVAAAALLVVALTLVVQNRDAETPADVPVATVSVSSSVGASTTMPASGLPPVVDVGDRLLASFSVDNTADSISIADDAVWVSGWDGRMVSRIDLATNDVVTVDVGSTGTRVAAGLGGVWVGVDGGQVLRLDPVTAEVIETIEIGDDTPEVLAGRAAMWAVASGTSTLSRIDPQTNKVTATIDVSPSGSQIIRGAVVSGGAVWVSLCDGGLVSVDEQTMTVSEPIAVEGCAGTLGFLDGSLWASMAEQQTIRVDPVDRVIETVIEIGPNDGAPFMATGAGAVWVPLDTATVARIDTTTNTVTEILDLGRAGQTAGLQIGHGSLWAGDYATHTILRIQP